MYRWMDTDARIFMSGDMNTVVHRDDFVRMGRAWADIVDTMFTVRTFQILPTFPTLRRLAQFHKFIMRLVLFLP